MIATPFLTDLDSRAAVKGSRDPLGIQQIWTRLGRRVVGNLTTVSNSLRDFTTLLLGDYFAELLSDELGPGTELATFLKWEQLAAYSRATANNDFAFRGTERVRKNLAEGHRVTLSDERSHQILGDQKTYGLWGLYTMPARASGLLDRDPARLTPPAVELVTETYIPLLAEGCGRDARRILDLLRPALSRLDPSGKDQAVVVSVGKVLRPRLNAKERGFYRFHLLHGGPSDDTGGCQQQLAELLGDTLTREDFAWTPAAVGELAKAARAQGEPWHPLARHLHRIRTCEAVLAPASAAFTHLLGLDNKTIDGVCRRFREQWRHGLRTVDVEEFRELRGEIGANDMAAGERWVRIAECLAGGEYGDLVELLISQNKAVMAARGGAPWLETQGGRLRVRFRDEHGALPALEQVPSLWRFPYFLDSLRSVAAALREDE